MHSCVSQRTPLQAGGVLVPEELDRALFRSPHFLRPALPWQPGSPGKHQSSVQPSEGAYFAASLLC